MDGQTLLPTARQAAADPRAAAPHGTIIVGYVGDFVVIAAVHDLRRVYPGADVRTRQLDWSEAQSALLEQRVDACVARLPFPFPVEGLRVIMLYDEPRVLVVPTFYRLADKESVEDKLEVVAGGEAVAVLPAGDQRSTLRHDLTTIPIDGIDPCQVVVFTRATERNHLVAAFITSARTHLLGITNYSLSDNV